MTTMPFQPLGDRARWRIVYDLLTRASVGDVISYEQLGEALNLDPDAERSKIQMAVRRAATEFLDVDKHALDVVPNEGYCVAQPSGHLTMARRHQSKASNELVKGHNKAINVDLSGVEPQTKHALEVVARAFALQMDFNRRLDVRQKRLEDALSNVNERTERTEEEIAVLRARLEQLEDTA